MLKSEFHARGSISQRTQWLFHRARAKQVETIQTMLEYQRRDIWIVNKIFDPDRSQLMANNRSATNETLHSKSSVLTLQSQTLDLNPTENQWNEI